jgi:hypothetical protein
MIVSQSSIHVMIKKVIIAPLMIAAAFLSVQETKAEGGCPSGMVPVGGGYCRNIVCPQIRWFSNQPPMTQKYDESTKGPMKKYNLKCEDMGNFGAWGDIMVPMR